MSSIALPFMTVIYEVLVSRVLDFVYDWNAQTESKERFGIYDCSEWLTFP